MREDAPQSGLAGTMRRLPTMIETTCLLLQGTVCWTSAALCFEARLSAVLDARRDASVTGFPRTCQLRRLETPAA